MIPPSSPSSDSDSSLKGKLLIADPSLHDQMFQKSVILLSEHQNDQGASGLILNQPTAQTVGDLLQADEFAELRNLKVYLGGPLGQQNLTFAVFWMQENTELQFTTRISVEDAILRMHKPGTLVRAFAGYASWTPGQLEEEIESNSWITSTANTDLICCEHEKALWADLLRNMSPYHKILAEAPDDIFLN